MNNGKINITKSFDLPARSTTIYPEPFAKLMSGRAKRALGDVYGLKKFGVNLTVLKPGGQSALLHRHSIAEEFVFIIKGEATLVTENSVETMCAGDCVGFVPNGFAHMLLNNTQEEVHYIEIGDREAGDEGEYPRDDIVAKQVEGKWHFYHKDGKPY